MYTDVISLSWWMQLECYTFHYKAATRNCSNWQLWYVGLQHPCNCSNYITHCKQLHILKYCLIWLMSLLQLNLWTTHIKWTPWSNVHHSFRWSKVQTSAQRQTILRPLWFTLAIPHKYQDSPCNYITAAPFHIPYNHLFINHPIQC
jgi:hypothetical protein